MHLSVPLSSITFNSDRQGAEAKGTLYLIGFHSAFLINKRRPSNRKILPLMALRGFRFGVGDLKTSLGSVICKQIKWEGLERRALSKTPLWENNPVLLVQVNQFCLVCFQLGEKGHSMSVTCKSSVENIYHMERAVAQMEFCVVPAEYSPVRFSIQCQNPKFIQICSPLLMTDFYLCLLWVYNPNWSFKSSNFKIFKSLSSWHACYFFSGKTWFQV